MKTSHMFFTMYQAKKSIQCFFGMCLIFGKVYKSFNLNLKISHGPSLAQKMEDCNKLDIFSFHVYYLLMG
jgi:hypothetical protein